MPGLAAIARQRSCPVWGGAPNKPAFALHNPRLPIAFLGNAICLAHVRYLNALNGLGKALGDLDIALALPKAPTAFGGASNR